MNRYELAVYETQSVLSEWNLEAFAEPGRLAAAIVDRLVAKGVIQSTDPDELVKVY